MHSLISYSEARSAAAAPRPGSLPPLAVAVRLAPGMHLASPEALVSRCVALTLVPHPALDALMRRAGAQRRGHQYHEQPRQSAILSEPINFDRAAETLRRSALTPNASTSSGKTSAASTQRVRLGGSKGRRHLTVLASGTRLGGHTVGLGAKGQLVLTPAEALAVLKSAAKAGWVLVGTDRLAELRELEDIVSRACTLTPVPGAPAYAAITFGSEPDPVVLHATEAVQRVQSGTPGAVVSIHPWVANIVAVHHSTTDPAHRVLPGLREWQSRFARTYPLSSKGLINALPPGAGKTVCAAAALSQLSATTPGHRSMIVVPAGLREQWNAELSRFFPTATLTNPSTGVDAASVYARWRDQPATGFPEALIVTPSQAQHIASAIDGALGTESAAAKRFRFHDLVIDEAAHLRNPATTQAQSLWTLRSHSTRAMLLTGTPQTHSIADLGELVAFVLQAPALFSEHPLDLPHPHASGDRLGALVFGDETDIEAHVPTPKPELVVLTPNQTERTIEQEARARVAQLLRSSEPRAAVALRSEVEAWRSGLAHPMALLDSKYDLAVRVKASLAAIADAVDGAPHDSSKTAWASDMVVAEHDAGRQVLVFCDSVIALSALAQVLTERRVRYGVINSSAKQRQRAASIAAFDEGSLPVLLVGAAGQLGLNLQRAATIIHLDLPTTSSAMAQRTARAVRMGSNHQSVRVLLPVLESCADQRVYTALDKPMPPRALAEHLLPASMR